MNRMEKDLKDKLESQLRVAWFAKPQAWRNGAILGVPDQSERCGSERGSRIRQIGPV